MSRVTGGQRSEIDGTLRSEIPGANLFLLNPSGVLFGANARLDLRGSLHVSTADVIRLADGGMFYASLGEKSVLTVAAPAAFGFLHATPAAIRVDGSDLAVRAGKALSLIGGDIQATGGSDRFLLAPNGQVTLVSAASIGEVGFGFDIMSGLPVIQVDHLTRLGAITLTGGATLQADGVGRGTVLIRGGRLLIDTASIFANALGPVDGMGLGIDVQATEEIVMKNGSLLATDVLSTGKGRDIRLATPRLHMDNAAVLSGGADGGAEDITVDVGTLHLTGGL